MSPELRDVILDEFDSLRREQNVFKPLLLDLSHREPTQLELRSIGGLLQSIYTGMERVLKHALTELDGSVPTSASWHADLLRQAADETAQRTPLITDGLYVSLVDLMGFRHMYRHAYGFHLSWERMKASTLTVSDVADRFQEEIGILLQD